MIPLAAIAPLAAKWWKLAAGLVLGFLLCWPVASCSGRADGRRQMQQAIDRANVAFLQIKAQADAVASRERLTDTIAVSTHEREMIDAIRQGPDSAPDDAARRLGCQRLRSANPSAPPVPGCR